jgi:hypothetical protein
MSTSSHAKAKAKRLRFAPLAIATGVLGAVLLSVSMSGTLSAFTASILNPTNTAATGVLTMQETGPGAVTCSSTDGGTVSTNSATCSGINKFGGSTTMVPGTAVNTPIVITNTGTVKANSFTLTPGACTKGTIGTLYGTATDICSKMTVVITNTTASTTIFTGTLATLATSGAISVGTPIAGAATNINFAITLPASGSAATDNTYQGLSVAMPLTWTMTS